MSSFDDVMAMADPALFTEMGTEISLNGINVPAVVSPMSSYQTVPDGFGGFQKLEGAQVEVLTSDAMRAGGGSLNIGMPVIIPGSSLRNYLVVQIKENGMTSTLILSSTAGTAAQF